MSLNPETDSDTALIAAWRGGDRKAGDTLMRACSARLRRFFRDKVDGGLEDLIQQTMLAGIEGLPRLRADASFRAYLYAIATHQLYAHWNARKRGPADARMSSLVDLAPGPSTALAAHEAQARMLATLRTLPLETQVLLELHYWEELSGSELAETFACSEGTIRSRLRRAKARLVEAMAAG